MVGTLLASCQKKLDNRLVESAADSRQSEQIEQLTRQLNATQTDRARQVEDNFKNYTARVGQAYSYADFVMATIVHTLWQLKKNPRKNVQVAVAEVNKTIEAQSTNALSGQQDELTSTIANPDSTNINKIIKKYEPSLFATRVDLATSLNLLFKEFIQSYNINRNIFFSSFSSLLDDTKLIKLIATYDRAMSSFDYDGKSNFNYQRALDEIAKFILDGPTVDNGRQIKTLLYKMIKATKQDQISLISYQNFQAQDAASRAKESEQNASASALAATSSAEAAFQLASKSKQYADDSSQSAKSTSEIASQVQDRASEVETMMKNAQNSAENAKDNFDKITSILQEIETKLAQAIEEANSAKTSAENAAQAADSAQEKLADIRLAQDTINTSQEGIQEIATQIDQSLKDAQTRQTQAAESATTAQKQAGEAKRFADLTQTLHDQVVEAIKQIQSDTPAVSDIPSITASEEQSTGSNGQQEVSP